MFNIEEIKKYIVRDRPKGLIIDTNLLILFLIGKFEVEFIEKCKLTCNNCYSRDDYDLLCQIIKLFKKVIITPHIIAEISNLSRNAIKDEKLVNYLKVFIEFLKTPSLEERSISLESFFGIKINYISSFGFTDMAIHELSKNNNFAIITDDSPFYQFSNGKTPTIKFQHIKNFYLNSVLKS